MRIGTVDGREVLYFDNTVWIKGTNIAIYNAGTKAEAIERAKRNFKNFIEY